MAVITETAVGFSEIRALEDESIDKLYRAGADHVVSPNVSGAIRMASMLLRPELVEFLDISTRSEGLDLRFEQASIAPDSNLAGRSLTQAQIPRETGLLEPKPPWSRAMT